MKIKQGNTRTNPGKAPGVSGATTDNMYKDTSGTIQIYNSVPYTTEVHSLRPVRLGWQLYLGGHLGERHRPKTATYCRSQPHFDRP